MTKEEMKARLKEGLRTFDKPKCLVEKTINGKIYREWTVIDTITKSVDALFSESEGSIFNIKF